MNHLSEQNIPVRTNHSCFPFTEAVDRFPPCENEARSWITNLYKRHLYRSVFI